MAIVNLRLVAVIVLALTGPAAADCPPSAVVRGEPDVTEGVGRILRERGLHLIETAGDPPAFSAQQCPHVTATVVRGGGRIAVWIVGRDGQRAERITEDFAAAATVIESWVRSDLVSPLLAERRTPTLGLIVTDRSSETSAGTGPLYALVAGVDAGLSWDRSTWASARVQGCASVGRICIGGIVRYAYDTGRTGASRRWGTGRRGLDLSVTVGLPLARRWISITPYVGLGQLAVTATRALDESDPVPAKESEQASAIHLLVGGSAHAHVSPRWSVRLDLGAIAAPFATESLGDSSEDEPLPASPRMHAWLGLGLAYGGL